MLEDVVVGSIAAARVVWGPNHRPRLMVGAIASVGWVVHRVWVVVIASLKLLLMVYEGLWANAASSVRRMGRAIIRLLRIGLCLRCHLVKVRRVEMVLLWGTLRRIAGTAVDGEGQAENLTCFGLEQGPLEA